MRKRLVAGLVAAQLALVSTLQAEGTPVSLADVVSKAVANSPDLVLASFQVELARADEMSGSAYFDPTLKAGYAIAKPKGDELQAAATASNARSLTLGVSKLLENGIYTDLAVTMNSSIDDSEYSPVNPASIAFTINVPLLKGIGDNNMAYADYRSKSFEREAAEADLSQKVAAILNTAVEAYWDYKAAAALLKFRIESENQVRGWMDSADTVGGGGARLKGYLDEKVRATSEARQKLVAARNALATAIGISHDEAKSLGPAGDSFPVDWDRVMKSFDKDQVSEHWRKLALENRFDIKALELRFQGADAMYEAAKRDTLPKLDLAVILQQDSIGFGRDNLAGHIDSLRENTGELGHTISLNLEYPLGNNAARATETQTRLGRLQAEVQYNNSKRTISLDVDTVASQVASALSSVESTKRSADAYASSLYELQQREGGVAAGIFDLLDTETAWIDAVTSHVNALSGLAKAIINARLQTGTLIQPVKDVKEVSLNDLTRLP